MQSQNTSAASVRKAIASTDSAVFYCAGPPPSSSPPGGANQLRAAAITECQYGCLSYFCIHALYGASARSGRSWATVMRRSAYGLVKSSYW